MKMFKKLFPKIRYDDIALLIQGPFNKESLKTIQSSKFQFKQIIYSTWKDIKLISAPRLDGIEIYSQDLPNTDKISNTANIYYQITSTLLGLEKIKTKYCLKHRADESYSNMELLIKNFNPKKLLCSNIYFRPIKYKAYHISDHFFIGETSRLLDTFSRLKNYYDRNEDYLSIFDNKRSPEQIITLFYLSTFGYDIKELLSKQTDKKFVFKITTKYFDVFDIEKLKPYVVKHNHLTNTITDLKTLDKNILIKYISKISDIY